MGNHDSCRPVLVKDNGISTIKSDPCERKTNLRLSEAALYTFAQGTALHPDQVNHARERLEGSLCKLNNSNKSGKNTKEWTLQM